MITLRIYFEKVFVLGGLDELPCSAVLGFLGNWTGYFGGYGYLTERNDAATDIDFDIDVDMRIDPDIGIGDKIASDMRIGDDDFAIGVVIACRPLIFVLSMFTAHY